MARHGAAASWRWVGAPLPRHMPIRSLLSPARKGSSLWRGTGSRRQVGPPEGGTSSRSQAADPWKTDPKGRQKAGPKPRAASVDQRRRGTRPALETVALVCTGGRSQGLSEAGTRKKGLPGGPPTTLPGSTTRSMERPQGSSRRRNLQPTVRAPGVPRLRPHMKPIGTKLRPEEDSQGTLGHSPVATHSDSLVPAPPPPKARGGGCRAVWGGPKGPPVSATRPPDQPKP